jgi:hypothetical protein
MNFGAMDNYYELITNYQRLKIKTVINNQIKLLIIKTVTTNQILCLNSNYRIEFIILSNLIKFLQILEV